MIGVGIIGAGWWAGEHARAVAAVPGLRLAAFSSQTPARRAAFQAEFGVDGVEDYRLLLTRPDIDAVAIATPHDTHARTRSRRWTPGSMCCWKSRWRAAGRNAPRSRQRRGAAARSEWWD